MLEICNALRPTCDVDWDAVSAIATVAATATALLLPTVIRSRDRQERREALAYSLLLKMIKIHSDLFKIKEHVLEQRALAQKNGAKPDTWNFFRPLATLPTSVAFSSDELSVIFSPKDDNTFNEVLSMDEVHRSDLEHMRVYGEKREWLTQQLPEGQLAGLVGSSDLDEETYAKLAPYSAQLNDYLRQVVPAVIAHSDEAGDALRALHKLVRDKLGLRLSIVLPEEPKSADEPK